MVEAYAAGASGYFTKPLDEEELEQPLQLLEPNAHIPRVTAWRLVEASVQ